MQKVKDMAAKMKGDDKKTEDHSDHPEQKRSEYKGPQLPKHKLGRHGPEVTSMGYGFMGLVSDLPPTVVGTSGKLTMSQSSFYGKPKPDEERMKLIDKIYNDGELFWDSADMYGDSEDLLGVSVCARELLTLRLTAMNRTLVREEPRKA